MCSENIDLMIGINYLVIIKSSGNQLWSRLCSVFGY